MPTRHALAWRGAVRCSSNVAARRQWRRHSGRMPRSGAEGRRGGEGRSGSASWSWSWSWSRSWSRTQFILPLVTGAEDALPGNDLRIAAVAKSSRPAQQDNAEYRRLVVAMRTSQDSTRYPRSSEWLTRGWRYSCKDSGDLDRRASRWFEDQLVVVKVIVL
jgi:hypothetical protein